MKKIKIFELFPDKAQQIGQWHKGQKQLQKEIDKGWKIESTTCTPTGTCLVFLSKEDELNMLND